MYTGTKSKIYLPLNYTEARKILVAGAQNKNMVYREACIGEILE